MGRFLVVVVILVAIAWLANKYLLGKGDVPPVDAKAAASAKNEAGAVKQGDADLVLKTPETTEDPANVAADKVDAVADAEDANVTPGEDAAAEAVASADVGTDLEQEPGVAPKVQGADKVKVSGDDISKMLPTEAITLGDPSLTAGIPGEGD